MTKRPTPRDRAGKAPAQIWPPEMLVTDVRASLRRIIQTIWKQAGATPTRAQLLAADVPPHIIDLFFRSVLLEIVRDRVQQVIGA